MGRMGSSTLGVLLAVLVLLLGSSVSGFDGYDGLPRPPGMDQQPTSTLGPKPVVKYQNKIAKCTWYAWQNINYPMDGTKNCSDSLWSSLSSANPAELAGFMYYVPLEDYFYDPSYDEYLCAIGCFDLSGSGGSSPSPVVTPVTAPPGDAPVAIPPDASAKPPSTSTPQPSPAVQAPPPAATLFRPPPPALPLPPAPTPGSIAMAPMEAPFSPEYSPVASPAFSPVYSPDSTPGDLAPGILPPGFSSPGPAFVQDGSGSITSPSVVFAFSIASLVFLCFLV